MTLEEYVVMVLENGDVGNAHVEYNVNKIVEYLKEQYGVDSVETSGLDYILNTEISEDDFWAVVSKHERATRLEELWDEWTRAFELLEYENYITMDRFETVDSLRGVLKDTCLDCSLVAFDSADIQVTLVVWYEPHESYPEHTCALCGKDFWGMKDGALVLFEPEYAMKRWG